MVYLALIGSGKWGKQYIKSIASIKDCALRYICSPKITSDASIPDRYVKVADYRKLLSNKEIDGVIIATPPGTHFTIASHFLKNRYSVLIEKPLTTSYKDALKLKTIADATKSVCMVGHLYHYNPAFQELLKLRNKIGSLRFIQANAGKPECFFVHDSALWDWGPHDIAMCLEALGVMPTAVSAQGVYIRKNIDSQVRMTLFFQDEIRAFLHLGWCFPRKERLFTMTGLLGHLSYNDLEKKIIVSDTKGNTVTTTHNDGQPLQEQLKQFVQCIKNKKMPETGIDEGLNVVKVLHFAEKSMQSKGRVTQII